MEVWRKYNTNVELYFPLITRDGSDFDATPLTFATGDVKISKDGAAFANATNTPAHIGQGIYNLTVTASEMSAAIIIITVKDQGTKTWEDQCIVIMTFGGGSSVVVHDLTVPAFNKNTDTVSANVTQINSSGTAATKLASAANTMVTATAVTGTLSTTVMTTSLTETTDDHYKGRTVIFTSGNLQAQAGKIQSYNGTTKAITFTEALTEAPANTDAFVIV